MRSCVIGCVIRCVRDVRSHPLTKEKSKEMMGEVCRTHFPINSYSSGTAYKKIEPSSTPTARVSPAGEYATTVTGLFESFPSKSRVKSVVMGFMALHGMFDHTS